MMYHNNDVTQLWSNPNHNKRGHDHNLNTVTLFMMVPDCDKFP